MMIFGKFLLFYLIVSKRFTLSLDKLDAKKTILLNAFEEGPF